MGPISFMNRIDGGSSSHAQESRPPEKTNLREMSEEEFEKFHDILNDFINDRKIDEALRRAKQLVPQQRDQAIYWIAEEVAQTCDENAHSGRTDWEDVREIACEIEDATLKELACRSVVAILEVRGYREGARRIANSCLEKKTSN